MTTQHYNRKITVKNTPESAYKALTQYIEYWWTKPDVPINAVGDKVKFTFPPGQSYWTFEAITLVPNQYIKMMCIDALHLHQGQPKAIEKEWLDTNLVFEITANGKNTDIKIEHIGLTSSLLCYEVCQAGWDFFFCDSLKAYLDTGIGKPHTA